MKKLTLTSSYLQECLKQARYYEFCKDSERALTVLQPIWNNIEEPPNTEDLSELEACEILLVCGSVISVYGTTHQKKHYKELAVDMLTRARELAISIGERDLISEAEKQMAVAYWRHGEFENAVAFLNTVLSKYSEAEQLVNKICLMAQANLLVLYYQTNQTKYAFELFQKIKPFVDTCDDLWVKTVFYNQAAGLYVLTGHFKHAIPLLEKDIEYAALTKNSSYLGNALNNLANAYINLSPPDTRKAMKYVDEAIELFLSINQVFPYALALETKSLIYCYNNDFKKALLTIEDSIRILEKGENYAKLCESLWTRTEILIKTGETKKAMKQFNSLLQISNENVSLLVGDRYIEQFLKMVHIITGSNFEEKELNFRHRLLDDALAACGGIVTTTANFLGIMHQTLSAMLKKFPRLLDKHQVKLRKRSAGSLLPKETAAPEDENDLFAVRLTTDRLDYLGLLKGMTVEFIRCPLEKLDLKKPVVIKDFEQNYHCGLLINLFGMIAFEDARGDIEKTFLPSDISEYGQVTGIYDPKNNDFIPLENF